MDELGVEPFAIILEPTSKNTAASILASLFYLKNYDLSFGCYFPNRSLISEKEGFAIP